METKEKFAKPKFVEIVRITQNGVEDVPLEEYERRGVTDEKFLELAKKNMELYKDDLEYLKNKQA